MQKHELRALVNKYATKPKRKTVAFSEDEPKIIAEQPVTKARTPAESPSTEPSTQPQSKVPIWNAVESETLEIPTIVTRKSTVAGKYVDWNGDHAVIAAKSWTRIGELMAFCDRYEFKSLSLTDTDTHNRIVNEVTRLLTGPAPFDVTERFPVVSDEPAKLWICVGRCPSIEYHLNRILAVFRKPIEKLTPDKQRVARQNFNLAVNELRLDISARITGIRIYDRMVFEREFHLTWRDPSEE